MEQKTVAQNIDKQETICKPPAIYAGNEITGLPMDASPHVFSYKVIPAEYHWVDGKQSGFSIEFKIVNGSYKTITELIPSEVPCPSEEIRLKYPEIYICDKAKKVRMKRVSTARVIKPVRVEKCKLPFQYENGKTLIEKKPSRIVLNQLRE